MASPVSPAAHSSASALGSAFYLSEEVPTVASMVAPIPMSLAGIHTAAGITTRSRTASYRSTRSPRAVRGTILGPRKRRPVETGNLSETTPSSGPRKRARASLKMPPPQAQPKDDTDDQKLPAMESCCICMCDVDHEDMAGISGCEHKFCFGCIEKWAERENSCPLCKNRFTKIDRINKKRKRGQKNTKKVKQRDQRTDLAPGAALEGLLANFAQRHGNPPSVAHLIFSGAAGFGLDEYRAGRATSHGLALFDEVSSDDEDESPFSTFIRAFQRVQMPITRPVSLAHLTASRSYATNSNDRNAGFGAENPLEIDDDSDDDAVEVVRVVNGPSP